MQGLKRRLKTAEAQRDLLQLRGVGAAQRRLLQLEQGRDAERELQGQLSDAQQLARQLQEQLQTEQVHSCNSGGAAA